LANKVSNIELGILLGNLIGLAAGDGFQEVFYGESAVAAIVNIANK